MEVQNLKARGFFLSLKRFDLGHLSVETLPSKIG